MHKWRSKMMQCWLSHSTAPAHTQNTSRTRTCTFDGFHILLINLVMLAFHNCSPHGLNTVMLEIRTESWLHQLETELVQECCLCTAHTLSSHCQTGQQQDTYRTRTTHTHIYITFVIVLISLFAAKVDNLCCSINLKIENSDPVLNT